MIPCIHGHKDRNECPSCGAEKRQPLTDADSNEELLRIIEEMRQVARGMASGDPTWVQMIYKATREP